MKNFQIITYDERYRADFERLNRYWIERFFTLEESDKKMFENPRKKIIAPGGQIFFVIEDNRVQGTCAMMPEEGDGKIFELTKMAVDASARGKGFGDQLMQAALAFAEEKVAEEIFLYSNTVLEAAISLYKKYGFSPVEHIFDDRYQRANIMMRLKL